MRFCLIWIFFYSYSPFLLAQNRFLAQKTIDTLASEYFSGRGYINNGDQKAAIYIARAYAALGIKPFKTHQYFYPFRFPVNVFPGKCRVRVGRKNLVPGKDFIVHPGCPPIKKTFVLHPVKNPSDYPETPDNKALLYDTSYKPDKNKQLRAAAFGLKINLQKRLTWSVSTSRDLQPGIDILFTSMPQKSKKIKVHIQSKIIDHTAFNVLGYIEGSRTKDTFIVITAHYDHLGKMGNALFPGANDNASGIAMMLDLARHFSKHPSPYSLAFIAFAGEEPGLLGSKSYTDNAWDELPLSKMKFLINLDLMGSGEKGMAVVNATIYKSYFQKLSAINAERNYLSGFKSRGKAANSDHYWFTERGVKGFFFYLMGNYDHYHDIEDNRNNLRLSEYYDKAFLLIRDFILDI